MSFFALFSECEVQSGHAQSCHSDEHKFDSFEGSLLIMFDAMLGNVEFDMFDKYDSPCPNPVVGTLLLALYMIVMTILLLNLLIAVLSTEHSDVYQNIKQEFQLVRAKIIYKSAASINQVSAILCFSYSVMQVTVQYIAMKNYEDILLHTTP